MKGVCLSFLFRLSRGSLDELSGALKGICPKQEAASYTPDEHHQGLSSPFHSPVSATLHVT